MICALTVQRWNVHMVVSPPAGSLAVVVKCAKDAVRWGLRPGRSIWTEGYDKRYCYDEASVLARIAYVGQHNIEAGRPAKPWDFIQPPW
jgi:hypothetical protein